MVHRCPKILNDSNSIFNTINNNNVLRILYFFKSMIQSKIENKMSFELIFDYFKDMTVIVENNVNEKIWSLIKAL